MEPEYFARLAAAVAGDLDSVVDDALPEVRAVLKRSDESDRDGGGERHVVLDDNELRAALVAVLTEFLALLQGEPTSDGAALAAVARRRFDQGVPLLDLLRNLRIGAAVIWERFAAAVGEDDGGSRALLAATPRFFEMVDEFSMRAHQIYRELMVRDARRDEQIRATLLDTVLYGESEQGAAFWDAAAALRIPRSGHFLVLDIMSAATQVPAVDWEALARSHDRVQQAWFRLGPRSQAGLISLRPSPDGDDDIAAFITAHSQVLMGVSAPFTSVSRCRAARSQAGVAVLAAQPGRSVVHYGRDVLDILMASSPDAARSLVAATLGALGELSDERVSPLIDTVRVWLDNQQSVAATAKELHCHRNTVNYRLRRFEQLTGRTLADNTWRAQVLLAVNGIGVLEPVTPGVAD